MKSFNVYKADMPNIIITIVVADSRDEAIRKVKKSFGAGYIVAEYPNNR